MLRGMPERDDIVVMKFGGTSVAGPVEIKRAARRIVAAREAGNRVVAVLSARGKTTDELVAAAYEISDRPQAREMDMLLSTGERGSCALAAMAINDMGHSAVSLTGSQAGIVTDSSHTKARIVDVRANRISEALGDEHIVLVAGFQGVSTDSKDVTTLGRGGSDTTAVALAAALGASVCEIYTDVTGVFSADPRVVPAARQVPYITYEEMLELAAHGAKVLHLRCVEYARRFNVPLRVRSSFTDKPGTLVVHEIEENIVMEQPIISGVSQDLSEAKITVTAVPDRPGEAALVFETVADLGVNLDMIVQNVSADGSTDITFTLPTADLARASEALLSRRDEIGFGELLQDEGIAKVSLVGAGMRSHPGVSATFFRTLADSNVNVEMISTSEIRISVVTRVEDAAQAVRALHTAFGLDAEGQAVIYAGTGR